MIQPKVMSAEEARVGFRSVLDDVMTGETIAVERYGKRIAVILSAREYERLQNDHRRLIEYIKAGNPADDVPWEQVKAEMHERGQLDDVHNPLLA